MVESSKVQYCEWSHMVDESLGVVESEVWHCMWWYAVTEPLGVVESGVWWYVVIELLQWN